MFNYFGSKFWLTRIYPEPEHSIIIEPFAGSAQYAFRYWDRDVILIETLQHIYDLWKWLQRVSPEEILSLPTPAPKSRIEHPIPQARTLIALGNNPGTSHPRNFSGSWEGIPSSWESKKKKIAENLHKIRHWNIYHADYRTAPNLKATWFIDPPYQSIIGGYSQKRLNYTRLGLWCCSRRGQVIVCENSDAKWLPFELLKITRQSQRNKKQEEAVYFQSKI